MTIQFYMLLIVSLLQLRLKQQAITSHDEHNSPDSPAPPQPQEPPSSQKSPTDAPAPPVPIFHQLPSDDEMSHPYHFFEMIGEKLAIYWKLGIHWLSTLRQIVHYPFTDATLQLLDSG